MRVNHNPVRDAAARPDFVLAQATMPSGKKPDCGTILERFLSGVASLARSALDPRRGLPYLERLASIAGAQIGSPGGPDMARQAVEQIRARLPEYSLQHLRDLRAQAERCGPNDGPPSGPLLATYRAQMKLVGTAAKSLSDIDRRVSELGRKLGDIEARAKEAERNNMQVVNALGRVVAPVVDGLGWGAQQIMRNLRFGQ